MKLSRHLLTRRAFLTSVALVSAHAALAQHYPTDPRGRLAVATYPFRARILAPTNSDRNPKLPGMDLAAFARYIRSEFNVFGIEPLHSHFPSTDPADIRKLRASFDDAGIRTVNIPVDADADLCSRDPAISNASFATYRKWIDIAVLLASPSIRIAVPGCGGAADIANAAIALQPVIAYGALNNVIINLENDDPVLGSAARIVAILAKANSPFLRALPDFANSLMGGDEAFNAAAVASMFAYAANIAHVKDAEVIHKVRRTASLKQLFTIARQANYKGYYSMESDSDVDPTADTHHLIQQCLPLM